MPSVARRNVLTSLAGIPLATILANPQLARAAAMGLEEVSITTAGGREVTASLALPETTPAPTIVVIHEWWGLNDQIKTVAAEYAKEGFVALAVDLYGGQLADDPDGARALMQATDPDEATDSLTSWIAWLKQHPNSTGKVGTVGFCFGGGWSLNASIAAPVDATVVYYGRVNRPAEDLKGLAGPVLGHFGTEDAFINEAMVGGFEAEMAKAGKTFENHWYVANHAFANPSSARYDEEDAALAWSRTLTFFKKHLG
ncbi:dienelactone hydrolase family protein [Pelagibius sp.]|uniref:dienelactone hydrolase family protein n=1 Tax=Pelagibius sp. TaxID=1931238 RepID=UPI00260CEEA4|nr:dienelactone hydrolase family protein [Pelagibius sp.]